MAGEVLMTLPETTLEKVPLRQSADGRVIYVGKTRVPLETVMYCYHRGDSPERIVDQYDALSLADVYLVIGYYLNHRAEIDAYLAMAEAERERIRREDEARFDHQAFKARLLARLAEQDKP
jgi:uncharacterized protein (DUF433 family)